MTIIEHYSHAIADKHKDKKRQEADTRLNGFNNYQLNAHNKRITKRLEKIYDGTG